MTRRALLLPFLLIPALAGCTSGALAPGSDAPGPSATPSAAPSVSTAPPQRFEDVDLAATLEPVPFEPADPASWGEWTTEERDAPIRGVDPAVFAGVPECQAAVEAFAELPVEEAVLGGYPYQGTFVASVGVSRMATPEDATAYVDSLADAAAACQGVRGEGAAPDGVVGIEGGWGQTPAADAAGMTVVGLLFNDTSEGSLAVLTAVDELVVRGYGGSGATVVGWDAEVVADIQLEIDALEAAAD